MLCYFSVISSGVLIFKRDSAELFFNSSWLYNLQHCSLLCRLHKIIHCSSPNTRHSSCGVCSCELLIVVLWHSSPRLPCQAGAVWITQGYGADEENEPVFDKSPDSFHFKWLDIDQDGNHVGAHMKSYAVCHLAVALLSYLHRGMGLTAFWHRDYRTCTLHSSWCRVDTIPLNSIHLNRRAELNKLHFLTGL